jgi:Rho GTPase-activating protein 1
MRLYSTKSCPTSVPCSSLRRLANFETDLMHEVSLRAASNRMDAHNLTIVLCPNLVSSSNPIRDVMMCAVVGLPHPAVTPLLSSSTNSLEGKTTLGSIVKLCIQRYYEIFDEILDRSEAIAPLPSMDEASASSSTSSSPKQARFSRFLDDDEEIDDGILVMPIGPGAGGESRASGVSPPSAWSSYQPASKSRDRNSSSKASSASGSRSMHTVDGTTTNNGLRTMGKAKSMISIENGTTAFPGGKKGSISIGRGTTKKSAGSGVEAIQITAAGFFTPPQSAPPVPIPPKDTGDSDGVPTP